MPTPTDLQSLLDLGFPFIAMFLSYLIQMEHWPRKVNMLIAGLSVIAAAVATLLVQHKATGNLFGDFLLVAGIAAGLQSGSFAPLTQWLKSIGSQPPPTTQMPAVGKPPYTLN
jgi:hypothetical protein